MAIGDKVEHAPDEKEQKDEAKEDDDKNSLESEVSDIPLEL